MGKEDDEHIKGIFFYYIYLHSLQASDFEYPDKFDKSDSDTSTDIDAIVDEYRQKIKVKS